jgi:hypothetical protein
MFSRVSTLSGIKDSIEDIGDKLEDIGDKMKAASKAAATKAKDPETDLDTEYQKEKMKEETSEKSSTDSTKSKKCLYCGELMQEAQMPGCPPYTKGFVCSKCGFVAFFVGTHMGDYYGVQMAKERLRETGQIASDMNYH